MPSADGSTRVHVCFQLETHTGIRKHFAHETIQTRQMRLIKVDTPKQLADIFTKALPHAQFLACIHGTLKTRATGAHVSLCRT